MPTKEEFIQQLAKISRSEKVDEKAKELQDLLPSLFKDDALR
jgi:flagellar hook assembly protein FlgD